MFAQTFERLEFRAGVTFDFFGRDAKESVLCTKALFTNPECPRRHSTSGNSYLRNSQLFWQDVKILSTRGTNELKSPIHTSSHPESPHSTLEPLEIHTCVILGFFGGTPKFCAQGTHELKSSISHIPVACADIRIPGNSHLCNSRFL